MSLMSSGRVYNGAYHVPAEMTTEGARIVAARQEFVQGLMTWLAAKYKGQNVHVWVNQEYLGLYVWGLAMHWRWGYSGLSREELREAIHSAPTVRLQSDKPLPKYSGLDDAGAALAYYSA